MNTHAALLLAAGGSRRLGQPKQLLDWNGISLVRHVARIMLETHPLSLIVVTGACPAPVATALEGLTAHIVHNPAWETGMASSLQCGWKALQNGPYAEAILIAACDQPFITSIHLLNLLAQRPAQGDIITCYGKDRGIPVCLNRHTLARAPDLHGDEGFRRLWQTHAPASIPASGLEDDIDTLEDYHRALRRLECSV